MVDLTGHCGKSGEVEIFYICRVRLEMTFSLRCLESFICLHVAVVLGILMVQRLEVQRQVILYHGHLPHIG